MQLLKKIAAFCFVFFISVFCTAQITSAQDESKPAAEEQAVRLPSKDKFRIVVLAGQSNMAGRGFVEPQDKEPMRIILKIIAAPAVLALTLIVAVLNFSVSLASWVLGILSLILAVCGLFELFIQSNPQWGITGLVLAFLLSPFGLPAAAEWLVCRLDDLNYSLKTFIAG